MSSHDNNRVSIDRLRGLLLHVKQNTVKFWRINRVGIIVITLATIIFFGPLIIRISSYSEGGDAMFNAWTLARDQHCILRQGCPRYVDGNMYFPNKNSMLYSETQLSAGLLTLPLHFLNDNPIFSYNVWTILSFFFSGLFMYMLAKYLSHDNEAISVLMALVFEFAPFKMTSLGHLQNLSIFYLPLIVLLFLKFLRHKNIKRIYVLGAFAAMVLLFYASWYQMVFGLMVIVPLLMCLLITRVFDTRRIAILGLLTVAAIATTIPLAKQYVGFSKTNGAKFSIYDQVLYSSSVKDYFIPYSGTAEGKLYYAARPTSTHNSYNPDSSSFHGISIYLSCFLILLGTAWGFGRRIFTTIEKRLLSVFFVLAVIGFAVSLGPLLKIGRSFTYSYPGLLQNYVLPLPYILVDRFLPQLSFIRAIGRASVIFLFSACCIIALGSILLQKLKRKNRFIVGTTFAAVVFFELMPLHLYGLNNLTSSQHLSVPAVYRFVASRPEINNLIILRSDKDYQGAGIPIARAEDVLWAGYHNRNIFNGYSGYEPASYSSQQQDFVDFHADDVAKLKKTGLNYAIVDKYLSSSNPALLKNVSDSMFAKVYEDSRYALFKI